MAPDCCVWPTECVLGSIKFFFLGFHRVWVSLKRTKFEVTFSGKECILVGQYEGHFELSVLS